jgi:hypothetical protein
MPSAEVPEPVTDAGLRLPLTPVGNPLTLSNTTPPKPLMALRVIVELPELPAMTVTDDADNEKSGGGVVFTTRLSDKP